MVVVSFFRCLILIMCFIVVIWIVLSWLCWWSWLVCGFSWVMVGLC